MNIIDLLEIDMPLEEGKKFFKESKKIDRTIEDLQKKIYKLKNKPEYTPLRKLLNKLKRLRIQFEEIESSKESGKLSREKINKLKSEHKELISIVNSHEVRRILKDLGLFILFGSATLLLGNAIAGIQETHSHQSNDMLLHHKSHPDLEATNVSLQIPEKNYDVNTIHTMVAEICNKEHVSFDIIKEIIKNESDWKLDALGVNAKSKDIGLMQLNSRYIKWFVEKFWDSKRELNPTIPRDNVTLGIRYFKWLLKVFHNDTEKALMAYNAGPTAVLNDKIPKNSIAYAKRILKALAPKTA